MAEPKILAMIMAGGRGERLEPLTKHRAKPAVPFGGKYRIVDFVLSNFINSRIYSLYVLTQYKAQSLLAHLREGWLTSGIIDGSFIIPVPAQMRKGKTWYVGTADSVYQNVHLIQMFRPDIVAVFGADHIYRMDVRQMVASHCEKQAEITVATIPTPISDASYFGVMEVDKNWRVLAFEEKPSSPTSIPDNPDMALISMGNYLFQSDVLIEELERDSTLDSSHDFGKDIIPSAIGRRSVFAYDFRRNNVPGCMKEENFYWRDIGIIRAYFEANMDLKGPSPSFNLYNRLWPLRTATYVDPPAKFIYDEEGRKALVWDSVISDGSIISGGQVKDSIISRNVFVGSQCLVEDCIIMDNVIINKGARIRKTIIDKNVTISSGVHIGYDVEQDKKRFYVDPGSNIVVIPKGIVV